MSQSTAASRYAKALFQLAQEKQLLAQVNEDLREVKLVFEKNPEIFQLLDSPKLEDKEKKELVSKVFASIQPIIVNAIKVLIDKKRIHEVVSMIEEFIRQANDTQGVADAIVYTTHPLTAEETGRISTAFAAKVGKNALNITNEIDPTLIGGVRLQIGNQIFDSSLSHKLAGLKRTLIG
ncbi:F0F1 ATP synthase subunit delta [Viridibacillus sp. YIM B01967]|uniref:ATP synthase subunit delta n=1 Tax=Viridibacillus soli TaxID=2798301 RepID=A0ABS1H884_9BACL|nr:F0F1 ATP synthase subunit delta [Viridibacillus soli]MBK3495630.1 F0F1 ATP synthase subunit delta [Viridibacillus soli]